VLGVLDMKGRVGVVQTLELKDIKDDQVVLTALPTHNLKVVVKDKTGNPLAGAKVYLTNELERMSKTGETNSAGEASYKCLRSRIKYSASAYLDGYYDPRKSGEVPDPGSVEWTGVKEIVMEEARRTLKGKVVDEEGKPAVGVQVRTTTQSKTKTDANGEFTLNNLPNAEVHIFADTLEAHGNASADKDAKDLVITIKKWE
jgi:hypothetical protein